MLISNCPTLPFIRLGGLVFIVNSLVLVSFEQGLCIEGIKSETIHRLTVESAQYRFTHSWSIGIRFVIAQKLTTWERIAVQLVTGYIE